MRCDSIWIYFLSVFFFCTATFHIQYGILDFSKIIPSEWWKNLINLFMNSIFSYTVEMLYISQRPLSVSCEEHCGASQFEVIIRLTCSTCASFPPLPAFHTNTTPLVTCESHRNHEQNLNICFPTFILHPWPFSMCFASFQPYLSCSETTWNFLCRAWNCADVFLLKR